MSPPRVVVVDHYDSYTWNLVHLFAQVSGRMPEVVEHDRTSLADLAAYTHVVLSPGPGHPADPAYFAVGAALIATTAQPVLGVCLGMQGLVTAYGGRVDRIAPAHGEVASVSHRGTGLFAGVPTPFDAVRYHSLAALEVPDELDVTAWCPGEEGADGEEGEPVVMGVAHRTKPQVGVQFHPESVLSTHGATLVANFLELR